MEDFDFEIYKGKSFRNVCEDIVIRSQQKKDQLDILFSDIRNLIKSSNDAQMFLPHIKELLSVGVKNDEQLIKLVAVLQRLQSTQMEVSGPVGILSDEEKEQLLKSTKEELNKIQKEIDMPVSSSISIAIT